MILTLQSSSSSFRRMRAGFFLLFIFVGGCGHLQFGRGQWLVEHGHPEDGVALLKAASEQHASAKFRIGYLSARDKLVARRLDDAAAAQASGKNDMAAEAYRKVLLLQPDNALAEQSLSKLARDARLREETQLAKEMYESGQQRGALAMLTGIVAQAPDFMPAQELKTAIEQSRNLPFLGDPALSSALDRRVTLEFRNASLGAVLDVLSQASGLNLILDKNLPSDTKVTIFTRDTTVADALALVTRTANIRQKALNENTLLIYPATEEKIRQYQDLVVRNFYLGSADARKIQDLTRAIFNPRTMYVNEEKNILTVRDTPEMLDAVERLIVGHDTNEPEVVLDVEILEVSSDKLLNLGIEYPDTASASLVNAAGAVGGPFRPKEIDDISDNNVRITFPDPAAVLNLKKTDGKADTLARPRIRAKNNTKARVVVGDKVPVVTTSNNQTSGTTQESISYLDVGLTLEVTPEVHVNNDVSVALSLEVSNIIKEVKSATGLLTYQIGTRSATTLLRIRDGETQALAGLIRDDNRTSASRVPLLGDIPLLGKLFSNENHSSAKSEIVLLMTPHIVRPYRIPDTGNVAFSSGTAESVTTQPFRVSRGGEYSSTKAALTAGPEALPANTAEPLQPDWNPAAPKTGSAAAGLEAPSAQPPPAPGSDGFVPHDPEAAATADISLEFIAPPQVPPRGEFTIALLANGSSYGELVVQIQVRGIDPKAIHASQPNSSNSPLPVEVRGSELRLRLPASAEAGSGVVALLRSVAPLNPGETLQVNMVSANAVAPDGKTALHTALAPEKVIRVMR